MFHPFRNINNYPKTNPFLFVFNATSKTYRAWLSLRGLILFTNPSARAGYDTRSTFKQSLTGLNSEFSFS